MPVPHLEIRIVQRSKGSSAVAGAAYQAGEKLFSEYDQKMKNYLYKKEVVYTEVMLPTNAPPGYADRATLWNAAEEVEKQWNLEDQYTLTSEKKIQKAISIVADCNKYHPIRDYLNGLEWDGTERIRCALPHFLGAEESEFTYECLRLFMLGAISRVFKPGSKFETMLCLVGGQGAGKSTFFRLLAMRNERIC